MTKDPFAAYSLPIGIAKGVDLPLAGTPMVLKVKLPATLDEEYQALVMQRLSRSTSIDNETGEVTTKIDGMELQRVRKEVFFEHCILNIKGLPKGMDQEEFFLTYPLAAREVFDQAAELALAADQEAEAALGKLKSTQGGKTSGQEK